MRESFLIALGFITLIPLLFLFWLIPAALGTGLASHSLGKQVATRGARIYLMGFALLLILLFILSLLSITKYREFLSVTTLVLSFYILVSILSYIPNKLRSGKCLLHVGYTSTNKVQIIIGCLMIGMLTYAMFSYPHENTPDFSLLSATLIMNFILGVSFLTRGLTPLQIREHGILWSNYTKWGNIKEYYWETDKPTTLTLNRKNGLGIFEKMSLPIPAAHKENLDKVLREKTTMANTG